MLSTRIRNKGPRGRTGRKPIQFDLAQVRALGRIGATDWDMANLFCCSVWTIQRARKQQASGIEAAYQQGFSETNILLRKRLLERALGGNSYLLWKLCVARLGFVDAPACVISANDRNPDDTVRLKLLGVVRLMRRIAQAEARKNGENPE